MLFHNHFYDFEDEDGREICAADKVYWTEWDFALADAIEFIADHTDQHGHLVWEAESDRVDVEIVKKIDKHEAAVQRRTNGKKYKPTPGEYFVSRLILSPGYEDDGWPDYDEWFQEQQRALGE